MQSSQLDSIGSAEAAAQLGIDRSTLTRWVRAGKITPILRGAGVTGEMFFERADIDALLSAPSSSGSPQDGEGVPIVSGVAS